VLTLAIVQCRPLPGPSSPPWVADRFNVQVAKRRCVSARPRPSRRGLLGVMREAPTITGGSWARSRGGELERAWRSVVLPNPSGPVSGGRQGRRGVYGQQRCAPHRRSAVGRVGRSSTTPDGYRVQVVHREHGRPVRPARVLAPRASRADRDPGPGVLVPWDGSYRSVVRRPRRHVAQRARGTTLVHGLPAVDYHFGIRTTKCIYPLPASGR
jgi:hypothetical protein